MLSSLPLLWRMLRWRVMLVIYLFAAVAYAVNGYILERQGWQLLAIASLLAAWYIHGTCLNDLADENIDKINLRHAKSRPLANNKSSRKQLWIIAIGSAFVALCIAISQSVHLAILTLAMLLLNWAYSFPPLRISYRGIVAPLTLPLGYVLFPYVSVMLLTSSAWTVNATGVLIGLYAGFVGRIVLKDFRDVVGDRKYGKLTYLVRYGTVKTLYFSAIFWAIGSAILAILYWSQAFILSIVITVHTIGVMYGIYLLHHTKPDSYRNQVIIGGLGRLASVTLICIVLYGERGAVLERLPPYTVNLLTVIVAVYGLLLCLDSFRHAERQKVVF